MKDRQPPRLNLKDIVWSNHPYDSRWQEPKPSTFPRGLEQYEILLRFNRRLLEGKSVLDFGCGTTNLKQGLARAGIHPTEVHMVDINPKVRERNPDVITMDGRHLQSRFEPNSIDFAFALASTFQISEGDRQKIFRQLLRTSRIAVHMGPIYRPDFDYLNFVAAQYKFNIIVCRPFVESTRDVMSYRELVFEPATVEDYDSFVQDHDATIRIIPPQADRPIVNVRFGIFNVDINKGSSYVILKRE